MAAYPLPRRSRTWVAARGEHWEGSLRRARVRPETAGPRTSPYGHIRGRNSPLDSQFPPLKGVSRVRADRGGDQWVAGRVCRRADGQEQCGGIDGTVPLHPTPNPAHIHARRLVRWTHVRGPRKRCLNIGGRLLDPRKGANPLAARSGRRAPATFGWPFSGRWTTACRSALAKVPNRGHLSARKVRQKSHHIGARCR